jgi:microcystin-dependent protein
VEPHPDIVTPATLGVGDPRPVGSQPIPIALPSYIAPTGEYPSADGPGTPMFLLAMIHTAIGQAGQAPFNALPPDGRLLTVDQAHMADAPLYSVIMNQFGGEPPSFALPDLRGRSVVGSNPGVAPPANTVAMQWLMATQSVPGFDGIAGIAAGMVVPFAGSVVPSGWVACDGSFFTQAQYPQLFALFGNAFGWLTTTEVTLPRLTDNVVIGAGAPYAPGWPVTTVGTMIGGGPLQGVCLNYLICFNGVWPNAAPSASVPVQQGFIGQIIAYAGNDAPPGWLFCDGSLLAIETYMTLFALIGNIYGGDGETNFAAPDLRGKVIVGPAG